MEQMNPLLGPPPKEIPLAKAPLIRVICQVRFPIIASIEKADFIASFQERLRLQYPVLRSEQAQGLIMSPQGFVPARTHNVWRFSELSGNWRVSLAPDFIALETTSYTSRQDFLGRLQFTLEALSEYIDPKVVDRLGIRYIDRVTGPSLANIAKLVRPEVLGMLATPAAKNLSHTLSESVFSLSEINAQLLVRTGQIPAQGVVDPSAIEPINEPSWLLDVDIFRVSQVPFDCKQIVADTRSYAERTYAFFRWAVTDEFLKLYGGNT